MDCMSEWVIVVFNANLVIFQLYHGENKFISTRTSLFQWNDDEVRFVLNQHASFYSASSLKQESADRHVAPLGHIILIPNQPIFALSPQCCGLSGKVTNTNFISFGLTRPGLEPTIYCTRGEHANHYHYTADVVQMDWICIKYIIQLIKTQFTVYRSTETCLLIFKYF